MTIVPPVPRTETIREENVDAVINLCLDTLLRGKQALVFCNTRRGAESQAERLAKKIKSEKSSLLKISEEALHTLSTPTKQCKRLALCLKKGVAFHHAGLHPKQRALIEEGFREGTVSIICSTPTLAMGLDLPAFRVIIRDLKRFGGSGAWGMQSIPVLEYEQMCGRAGRPGMEAYGEALLIAGSEEEAEVQRKEYVNGEPEEVYSKLAVEPVLRTYILSLVASGFVATRQDLENFFSKTFYAKQYGDTSKLNAILDSMIANLAKWEFLKSESDAGGFVAANKVREGEISATLLGKRVAELYLDPYTARFLIKCLKRAKRRRLTDFGLLHMIASTLEMRPWLRPRTREVDEILSDINQYAEDLLVPEPNIASVEYERFLATLKTAIFLRDWIEEVHEDALFERLGITPGEVRAKLAIADWILYASEELARLLSINEFRTPLSKLRLRLKHGAKEELLSLLRLKGVGRVRARKLFNARIRTLEEVKKAEYTTLSALVGKEIALSVKKQVGQDVSPEKVRVKRGKRKGQKSMDDYR